MYVRARACVCVEGGKGDEKAVVVMVTEQAHLFERDAVRNHVYHVQLHALSRRQGRRHAVGAVRLHADDPDSRVQRLREARPGGQVTDVSGPKGRLEAMGFGLRLADRHGLEKRSEEGGVDDARTEWQVLHRRDEEWRTCLLSSTPSRERETERKKERKRHRDGEREGARERGRERERGTETEGDGSS